MQDGHRISLALFDKGKFFYKKEKHGNCIKITVLIWERTSLLIEFHEGCSNIAAGVFTLGKGCSNYANHHAV